MRRVLCINSGSSSVKFTLYSDKKPMTAGTIDLLADYLEITREGKKHRLSIAVEGHAAAARLLRESLLGIKIDAILHRIVHGGRFSSAQRLTPVNIRYLRSLQKYAPLHQRPALDIVGQFKGYPNIACFDTMFHSSMPRYAKTYAISQKIAKKHGFIRYGFHGLAHSSMAKQAAASLGRKSTSLNLITCQLGSGISICAVQKGRSIDTTMGLTPLEGLMMGTRSGSVDPALVIFLCETYGTRKAMHILENESGLLGVGGSADMRKIQKMSNTLARDMFVYQVKKQVGSYAAALGRVDAVIIGGAMSRSHMLRRIFRREIRQRILFIEADEQKEMLEQAKYLLH